MNEHLPLPCLLIDGHPAWQMPELTSLRKLPPRATFWPFPSPDAARARLLERSPMVQVLNGDWEFRLFDSPQLEHLVWYGRGPWDNYSDRKASSTVGRYRSTVTEQYVPYITPQEHGHKTDVRWLQLTDAQGHGLEVSGDGLFEFNALHHADKELAAAWQTPQLTAQPEVVLNLDHAMRGLGTGLVVDTLPQYRLNAPEYRFTFDLKLI